MPKKPATGREAVFRGKTTGYRVQGVLTQRGAIAFNVARKELARFYTAVTGRAIANVSDADVIEYLARGVSNTEAYLRKLDPESGKVKAAS
jgi:hypothetical protein